MKTIVPYIILSAFLLASCSMTDEELWQKAESAKGSNNWDSTMHVCLRIIDEYPDGPYASWARFGIAESYRFKNQPREALNNYILFYDRYPDMQPSALSLFMIGYIYHNNLLVSDSARIYYTRFLQKYPNHDLAPTAKVELETLLKYPPETLRYGQAN
jgi:TolA-binding protein